VIESRFGSAQPWSLGIEEELFLVDAETLETVPAFSRVVGEPTERLKPEVFECLVEIATPVVEDADGVLPELRRLRGEVAARASAAGLAVLVAGTHALARGAGQPIVPIPRYERMAKELGERIYRQLVCGLHVHVSIADPETCLRAFEGVVPWLPVLLALSANSPFAEGEDTGLATVRAVRLLEMPTGGTPPVLRSWDDWEAATRGDNTRRHWDAWPRPEYGTLEVRVMDQQTDVRRAAAFAALVQALVRAVAGEEHEPYDRELYARRRADATRIPAPQAEVDALGELVGRSAILNEPAEAGRQREVAAAAGLVAVLRDVADRSLA
jgi:carboxylate-amine ligase